MPFSPLYIPPVLVIISFFSTQSEKKVSVQLDCSGSTNFLYNRECCVQVLELQANSSVVSAVNNYFNCLIQVLTLSSVSQKEVMCVCSASP